MRTSPVHDCLSRLDPVWGTLNDMPIARTLPASVNSVLQLFDLSALRRTGLKGPAAASWLQSHRINVPERANSWCLIEQDALIARLGRTEYLIEDGRACMIAGGLAEELGTPAAGVYPVLRQDAALLLRGSAVPELFAQTCSIDLVSICAHERSVALTMLAGISVTVIDVSQAHTLPCYRVWCDGTYGTYLWEALLEIAAELGGGAAGLATLYADLDASNAPASNQS